MSALTAAVVEFMASKEGIGLIRGGNLPVIGSLTGGSLAFKPSDTPNMNKGESMELPKI
jgi:hypothetical protein